MPTDALFCFTTLRCRNRLTAMLRVVVYISYTESAYFHHRPIKNMWKYRILSWAGVLPRKVPPIE